MLLGIVPNTIAQFSNEKLDLTNPNQTHVLVLKTGKRIKGAIKSIKNEDVIIQPTSVDSTLQFSLSEIRNIRVKGNIFQLDKKFDSKFPPTLSLFFTNTAFAMKKREKSYRTFWGNSMQYSKQADDAIEIGIGYSFPIFINGKFKLTTPSKNKKSRHGIQLSGAIAPVGDATSVIEISQVNTLGNEDRFFNLTFNYYKINMDRFFFSPFSSLNTIPDQYFSVAFGGGIRFGENFQLHLNKNVNFNKDLVDVNLLPSFGLNWIMDKHMISFGYMSSNTFGLNYYPLFESNFDDFIIFTEDEFSKLPFFSYSRIF